MSGFPTVRPRRLRGSENLRRLVRETILNPSDFVLPFFVVHGRGVREEIPAMPGNHHLSVDLLVEEAREAAALGIPAILLFGLPAIKDERGSEAFDPAGIVQQAVRAVKEAVPELTVITDVCVDQYTSHGHCGIVENGRVVNDATLEVLAEVALSHARAGADLVAPSDMMDGRVGAIRRALDQEGFSDTPIMSYAAKYASAFYGPFREACDSAPAFGDRRTYQMDPANAGEAVKEAGLDLEEGADMIMVKPALAYLDVIWRVKDRFNVPVAAYNVSGEFSLVKAAARQGWIDEQGVTLEILTAIKRAGADIIITYHARDAVRWLSKSRR